MASTPNAGTEIEKTWEAIGTCVFACQLFEIAFTFIADFVLIPAHVKRPARPLTPDAFKKMVRPLFRELSKHVDLTPEYRERLEQFLDARNVVVHRGVLQFSFDFAQYREFALNVAEEASGQMFGLIALGYEWAKRQNKEMPAIPPELEEFFGQWQDQFAALMEHVREHYPQMLEPEADSDS